MKQRMRLISTMLSAVMICSSMTVLGWGEEFAEMSGEEAISFITEAEVMDEDPMDEAVMVEEAGDTEIEGLLEEAIPEDELLADDTDEMLGEEVVSEDASCILEEAEADLLSGLIEDSEEYLVALEDQSECVYYLGGDGVNEDGSRQALHYTYDVMNNTVSVEGSDQYSNLYAKAFWMLPGDSISFRGQDPKGSGTNSNRETVYVDGAKLMNTGDTNGISGIDGVLRVDGTRHYGQDTGDQYSVITGFTIIGNDPVLISGGESVWTAFDSSDGTIAYYAARISTKIGTDLGSLPITTSACRYSGGTYYEEIPWDEIYFYDDADFTLPAEITAGASESTIFIHGSGQRIYLPKTAIAEGYGFYGWRIRGGSDKTLHVNHKVDDLGRSYLSWTLESFIQEKPECLDLVATFYREFTITFNAMGGTIDGQDKKVYPLTEGAAHDYGYDLNQVIPVREGYNFKGWFTDPECSRYCQVKTRADLEKFENKAYYNENYKSQLYAKWESRYCGENGGDNAVWDYDYETDTLTITGSGIVGTIPWDEDYNYYFEEHTKHVEIGEGITSLPDFAFDFFQSLESASLPSTLTSIGSYAFARGGLKTIDIPASVTSIGEWAFYADSYLETVSISDSLFYSLTEPENIFYGSAWIVPKLGGLSGKIGTVEWVLDTNYKLTLSGTGTVEKQGDDYFGQIYRVKEIEFGEGITGIGDRAFYYASNLPEITIPATIKTVGSMAFTNCDSLKSITIPSKDTEIQGDSFAYLDKHNTMLYGIAGSSAYYIYLNYFEDYAIGYTFVNICTHEEIINYPGQEADCTHYGISPYSRCKLCEIYIESPVFTGFKHKEVILPAIAATCQNPGKTAGKICSECGKTLWEQTDIPATSHTIVKDQEKGATCTEAGSTEGSHCSECGTEMEAQTSIPAKGHSFGSWKETKAATALAAGVSSRTCSVCKKTETRSIAKLKADIKLTYTSIPLQVKKSLSLKSYVTGLAKGDGIKSWKTSASKIATVDKNGKVSAKAAGTAKITVTLKSGKTGVFTIKVQKKAVKTSSIKNLTKNISLKKGKTVTLKPIVNPITSTEKITYRTSNKGIATVSSKGVVKGIKKGTAVITVKSGSKKFAVTVKVTA